MPLLPLIFKAAPSILAYMATRLKMKKTSAGIEANPRATNGGVMTALVTLAIALLGAKGIDTAGLEPVIAAAFGLIYTLWRMER